MDNGTTWGKVGGSTMRLVKYEKFASSTAGLGTRTVNFGKTLPLDKYMVLIDSSVQNGGGGNVGASLTSRTTSSVTVTASTFTTEMSVQIIAFE